MCHECNAFLIKVKAWFDRLTTGGSTGSPQVVKTKRPREVCGVFFILCCVVRKSTIPCSFAGDYGDVHKTVSAGVFAG